MEERYYPLRPTQRDQGAVEISGFEDPLDFDGTLYTQGSMPHLMQLLQEEYRRYLQREIQRRQAQGQQTISIEKAMSVAPYTGFFNFCVRYLSVNRPVESFAVDMNHGIKLSNHARVVVSPGTQVQGTMQDSGAVGITQGRSQPGLEGIYGGGEIPIT